jgi:GNAT superfamily N-acetyltransferase
VACRESHAGPPVGWSYFAADPYAERVWNVWWISVRPSRQGEGVGQAILSHVEQASAASGTA